MLLKSPIRKDHDTNKPLSVLPSLFFSCHLSLILISKRYLVSYASLTGVSLVLCSKNKSKRLIQIFDLNPSFFFLRDTKKTVREAYKNQLFSNKRYSICCEGIKRYEQYASHAQQRVCPFDFKKYGYSI